MTTRKRSGTRARRRGAAQVEAALVLVLLCLLLVSLVEFGRMLLVYNAVANAARAGVRYAIVNGNGLGTKPPLGPPEVAAVVKTWASTGMLDKNAFALSCTPGSNSRICVAYACNAPGCAVDVTVVYRYNPLWSYFPLSVPLGSTSRGVITY
jgi:Flp pilus assembly protein TadG